MVAKAILYKLGVTNGLVYFIYRKNSKTNKYTNKLYTLIVFKMRLKT